MKKILTVAFVAFAFLKPASGHAQLIVYDPAAFVQHVQQVIAWSKQYVQMVEQIKNQVDQMRQLKDTYEAMTGARGFGALANGSEDQAARRYLPPELSQVFDLYKNTIAPGYSALTQRIHELRSVISTLPPDYFPEGSDLAAQLNRTLDNMGTQRAVMEEAYRASTTRIQTVERLIDAIGTANDPKAIAELQARISAEHIMSINEMNRLLIMQMQQQLQQQQQDQQALEAIAKDARKPLPAMKPFSSVKSGH